ncbi:MAG: hypothetical protein B1H11_02960 [Desulfobacteraceae bacterium 4484_190.1]|nr:MAG: hypothetical protein B1H11_02960 [Desulfobacteraceae bacterium 4484_190.1]
MNKMSGLIIIPKIYTKSYISIGRYLSLFNLIRDEYGFRIIFEDDYDPANITEDIVIVLKSPNKHYPYLMKSIRELPKGKKLITYVTDLHEQPELQKSFKYTEFHISMKKMFERSDKILCPYDYAFNTLWPEFVEKYEFFPHFLPDYEYFKNVQTNRTPIIKCLVSGAISVFPDYYPLRKYIASRNNDNITILKHPGYFRQDEEMLKSGGKIGIEYYNEINKYYCALATSSTLHYVVAKYLEIPATGSLLMANYTYDLDKMGIKKNEHYVEISKDNFFDVLDEVLSNTAKYDKIRENAKTYIFKHFNIRNRFDQFKKILEEMSMELWSRKSINNKTISCNTNQTDKKATRIKQDRNCPSEQDITKNDPMVSVIVPTYNRPDMLPDTINSILDQTYQKFEIIVVNDAGIDVENIVTSLNKYQNITYVKHAKNRGSAAARNTGIKLARGKYIAYIDDDDIFYPNHLEILVNCLTSSDYKVAYADAYRAIQVPKGDSYETVRKEIPYSVDFSRELLLCQNISPVQCLMHERSCLDVVGLFDETLITHNDWDMFIKLSRQYDFNHIKTVTSEYRTRQDGSSTTGRLLTDFLKTMKIIYRRYEGYVGGNLEIIKTQQKHIQDLEKAIKIKASGRLGSRKVSIIIPVFNQIKYTRQCLETLLANTPDDLYELIVVDNASTDGTKEFMKNLKTKVTTITNVENLGFAKACNQGARAASGKYLVFLNNDIIPLPGWLVEMLRVIESDEGIGVVGSKLLFPDGTIQHAGVVISSNGLPYHLYRGCPDKIEGANKQRDFQIVTAACMLIERKCYFDVGGFDERYINGCEDIDLCLKVRKINKRVVYTPRSVLIHFEGQSEGRQDEMNYNRRLLMGKWSKSIVQDDNYYLDQDGMKLIVEQDGSFKYVSLPNRSPIKTSIIIVCYNSLHDINKCIDSIINNTLLSYEIVVVDNVSLDGTQEYLRTLKNAKVIFNSYNKGFSTACNQGIREARGEFIVLLNPDTMVTKGWDAKLQSHFKEGVGAVGPVSNYVAGLQKYEIYKQEDLTGNIDINNLAEKLYQWNRGKVVETKLLIGFCMMIKKDIVDKIGMLDETLFLGSDDLEYSLRLRNNGYKLLVATDTFIYHKGQASFKTESSSKVERLTQESQDALYVKLEKMYGKGQVPSSMELWGMDWFKPNSRCKSDTKLTSIVILTHNQLEYTKKCIGSIFRYTDVPFELIVVDNASTDGTVEYLESKKRRAMADNRGQKTEKGGQKRDGGCQGIRIIRNKENRGFAAGNNQGIAAAAGAYIVLLNNDVVVTPGWLNRMIACVESFPEAGIVGPRTNFAPGRQCVENVPYDIETLEGLNVFSDRYAEQHSRSAERVLRVVGFCMLIKRCVIEKIGGLDDRYGLGNFEDDDFSLRATLCGFQSWIVNDCFVHHFGNRTFVGEGIDYRKTLRKNWELFKEKWDMPRDLPYGAYNLSQIGRSVFDVEKDYIPLKGETRREGGENESFEILPVTSAKGGVEVDQEENESHGVVSIIINLSHHRELAENCIDSIKKHTGLSHEMIFIDTDTAEPVPACVRRIVEENPDCHLMQAENNRGLAGFYNSVLAEACSGRHVVFMHSDLIVSQGWLEGMVECIESHEDSGVVGPMMNEAEGVQKDVLSDYADAEQFEAYSKSFRKRNRHRYVPVKSVSGCCFACRRTLLEKIGGFDEELGSEKGIVDDLCMRAAILGYRNRIASDVVIHHCNSTREEDRDIRSAMTVEDRKILLLKQSNMAKKDALRKRMLVCSAMEKADELWQKDDISGACDALVEVIRQVPDDQTPFYALAEMLMDAKRFMDAREVLDMMPSDGDEIRKLVLFGYCDEGTGRYDDAESCADRVLMIDPEFPEALNLKGMIAYRKGDAGTAEQFFRRAIHKAPHWGEPFGNIGFMKWAAGKKTEGLEYFEKAFVLTPAATDIFSNYHAAVKSVNAYERAESVFREACALYPNNRRIKYLFIDVLIQRKNYADAMEEIEDAIARFDMDEEMISAALEIRNRLDPSCPSELTGRMPGISLCMIVKNEAGQIGRCLRNTKPIVDEIIVVDTGSTDRTKDIATIFGAKVFDFEWGNDFSEARNFAISRASGKWIFVMDADEIISPQDYGILRQVVIDDTSSSEAYSFVTRNYNIRTDIIGLNYNDGSYALEEAGVGWVPSEKVRLFRNDPRIRFEYPVHEMVEPSLKRSGIRIKRCPVPVHHYGQLNEKRRAGKGEAYYRIGRRKLDETGDGDVMAIYELAVQAGMLEKWDEAIELWQMLIAINPKVPLAYVNMATAFQKIGDYENAIRTVSKAMTLDPRMKEAPNDYGLYQLYAGNIKEAVRVLEDTVNRFPGYLSAQFKLAVAYCCDGRKDKAMEVFRDLERTEMGAGLPVSCSTIAKKFLSLKQFENANAVLTAASELRSGDSEMALPRQSGDGGEGVLRVGGPAVPEALSASG